MEDIQRRLSDLERWQNIMLVLTTVLSVNCCLLFHRVWALTRVVNSLRAIVENQDAIILALQSIN